MPSTLVHVGFAALIGTALLADRFDARAIAVVMIAAMIPDLDTFIGLWLLEGGHRTVLHNLVVPGIILLAVFWDVHGRENSYILARWGEYGYRVAWVSILGGWIIAHVLLDAFYNGVNLFWPLMDQFIDLSGELIISDQRGIVMTFIEFEQTPDGIQLSEDDARGSRGDLHYFTGVDLGPDAPSGTERRFPIADSGELFLLMITGYAAAGYRLLVERNGDGSEEADC